MPPASRAAGRSAEECRSQIEAFLKNSRQPALLEPGEAARAEARQRGIRLERISVRPDRDGLVELARLADAGRLQVHVERTFPLAEAGAAQAFLGTRPKGKVVLTT